MSHDQFPSDDVDERTDAELYEAQAEQVIGILRGEVCSLKEAVAFAKAHAATAELRADRAENKAVTAIAEAEELRARLDWMRQRLLETERLLDARGAA